MKRHAVWLRANLFATRPQGVLSLTILFLAGWALWSIAGWAVFDATWSGDSRDACSGGGACWAFIAARSRQIIFGFFPQMEIWRGGLAIGLAFGAVLLLWSGKLRPGARLGAVTGLLVLAAWLLSGGFGLPKIGTDLWGGFLLTFVITIAGCLAAFPLGVLLALGRQSQLAVVRILSTCFIEFWRGIPLITVLFMAAVMLPLFFPAGLEADKLVRALAGVALFAAAYIAEVVRGGLQALPRGQYEAAWSLGMGYWQTMILVILPQALRHVIPGLANVVIALFKDTTLVLIIGMFDFLGILHAALSDPAWLGLAMEAYLFAGLVFWIFCFGMSRAARALEHRGRSA